MGRLTRRIENGIATKPVLPDKVADVDLERHEAFYEIIKKLAHYEDLEEQGRLIELKYGKWIRTGAISYRCSECTQAGKRTSYCPHCGAKMNLKELEGE